MSRGFSVDGVVAAAILTCFTVLAWGQDSANPGTSLGDLARQTRAQHASTAEGKASKAQDMVDEMQQEQEASENAPTGFKNYDAGDYRMFVPFPYSLEGRDEGGGAVLLGSRLGITNTEVVAGTPIPIPPNLRDMDLNNLVNQHAQRYSSGYCSPIKRGERKAFQCTVSGAKVLGRDVMGSLEYVVGSHSLIPVMCVSVDDMSDCRTYDAWGRRNCTGNLYVSCEESEKIKAAIDSQNREKMTSAHMCEQIILPSIQLKEDIVVHPVTISEKPGLAKPVAQKTLADSWAPPVQAHALLEEGSQGASVAELARQTRQTPRDKAQTTLDSSEGPLAPAGFQSIALQFCQNPQQCWEATVVIPEKAEEMSKINGQHIFKAPLDGESILLYVGPADVNAPYRSLSDPDFVRMRDLANGKSWSREKADSVTTQKLAMGPRFASMTRFRYQRDEKRWWIGERVLISNWNDQIMLACTAPEEHFADAEAVCTTLVNSLRLP